MLGAQAKNESEPHSGIEDVAPDWSFFLACVPNKCLCP